MVVEGAPKKKRRAWQVLRWMPAALLGAAQAVAWGTMLGGGMRGVLAWVLLMSVVPGLGALTLTAVVIVAIWRRRLGAPVLVAGALCLSALWPAAWLFGMLQIPYPASLDDTTPAATVRLPMDGPIRVLSGGDRLATNRHAFTPDQRWAYDLVIDPTLVDTHDLEGYGCWRAEVVAPVAARVHAAHDGEPDVEPGHAPSNPTAPLGNYVVLELETGTFLLLAHLQRGSVSVETGQMTTEGQPIARCGNSGNTSEPHLHIHHQRQDPLEHPVNFAEGLPLYFRDHDGPPMPEGGFVVRDGRALATGAVVRHVGDAP